VARQYLSEENRTVAELVRKKEQGQGARGKGQDDRDK